MSVIVAATMAIPTTNATSCYFGSKHSAYVDTTWAMLACAKASVPCLQILARA